MRHKTLALVFFFLSLVLAAIAVVLGFRTLGGAEQAEGQYVPTVPPAAGYSDTTGQTAQTTPEGQAVQTTPEGQGTPAAPTQAPAAVETPRPGPVVPEQAQAVDWQYFADAGFLGNSVTSGLWLYNNDGLLPTDGDSHWFWANSLTILGASPYVAQMAGYDFGKIYIGFGINEVTYNKDTLRAAFDTVIDQLQADHPDAIIYLMSVTPVSKWCDSNRDFHRADVLAFNEMLQQIAADQQVWYLDVYPVLCGDDGFLPSDVTPDGVHFNPAHYQKWFDYLTTHYIPDGHTQPASDAVPAADETLSMGAVNG